MLAIWEQLGFQNSNSFIMKELILLNDHINSVIYFVMIFSMTFIFLMMKNLKLLMNTLDAHMLEFLWTLIPGFILILIAIPSLNLLYSTEESYTPLLSLKTLGHQWYWSYEFLDYDNLQVDSFMSQIDNQNYFRLLDVDNSLNLPIYTPMEAFVSSADVLHSWTVPSLGFKADANPGRLNHLFLFINKLGEFFGQCSELCGTNHSFMPIKLMVVMPLSMKFLVV